tara:strand:+ start:159 stop:323 length:165 start_codon:yes stop_codon:yes gene_type:complete
MVAALRKQRFHLRQAFQTTSWVQIANTTTKGKITSNGSCLENVNAENKTVQQAV